MLASGPGAPFLIIYAKANLKHTAICLQNTHCITINSNKHGEHAK